MNDSMHKKGFIDTCLQYGIEKTAAERIYDEGIYKEAFLGGLGRLAVRYGTKGGRMAARSASLAAKARRAAALASRGPRYALRAETLAAKADKASRKLIAYQAQQQGARALGGSRILGANNALSTRNRMLIKNPAAQGINVNAPGIKVRAKAPVAPAGPVKPTFNVKKQLLKGPDGKPMVNSSGQKMYAYFDQSGKPISAQEYSKQWSKFMADNRAYRKALEAQPAAPAAPAAPGAAPAAPAAPSAPAAPAAPGAAPQMGPSVGATPAAPAAPAASSEVGTAGEIAKKKGLLGRYGDFTAKHPLLGTMGIAIPTAYFTNKSNNSFDPKAQEVETMTPTEANQYNRMNSGNNLPGLGLDPYYFNGLY